MFTQRVTKTQALRASLMHRVPDRKKYEHAIGNNPHVVLSQDRMEPRPHLAFTIHRQYRTKLSTE